LRARVALVTGAARGQGRAHAVALARAGADVAVCDLGRTLPTVPYALGSVAELGETAALVQAEGRRCISSVVDVRDAGALADRVGEGAGGDVALRRRQARLRGPGPLAGPGARAAPDPGELRRAGGRAHAHGHEHRDAAAAGAGPRARGEPDGGAPGRPRRARG